MGALRYFGRAETQNLSRDEWFALGGTKISVRWRTRRCKDCGKVRYRWLTRSVLAVRPKGVGKGAWRRVKDLPWGETAPPYDKVGRGPLIECKCPGVRGPRQENLLIRIYRGRRTGSQIKLLER